ncbi:MAG: hypothetical protein COB35_11740 [Gammaproteobacteria bacterium]|nr:MAG: hypothetical protein COB35_11740 [Gammaproteobacteria bacterium]
MRVIGYLTLYGNYLLSSTDPFYYHVVNVFIHLLNGLVIYKLYFVICDYLRIKPQTKFILFVLAIWMLQPLNTQAVTYVVQRIAAMVALFSLMSLLSYLKWRTTKHTLWLIFAFFAFILAMLTKQNAAFLPVFIILMEISFAQKLVSKRLIFTGGISFFIFMLVYPFIGSFLHQLDVATRESQVITRFDYFNTQLTVHWLYLKKFLLMAPLTLTMDVILVKNETLILFAYFIHLSVIFLATYFKKSQPLIFFMVVFYYCAHLVESSIVPITDLAFEHRTYLPNVAISFIFVSLLSNFFDKIKISSQVNYLISSFILILLAVTTYQRNVLWQKPQDFYKNEYKVAPKNPRNLEAMGRLYAEQGNLNKAVAMLSDSLNLNFKQGKLTASSVTNLMKVFTMQGNYQGAVITGQKSLLYIKKPANKSQILSAMAFAYSKMNLCPFAFGLANTAKRLNPYNQEAQKIITYCKDKK